MTHTVEGGASPPRCLQLDFETRSLLDLRETGVYPYAAHTSTSIWCMAWAFDDDEPAVWTPGMPLPDEIVAHVNRGGEMRAWNAGFERIMWDRCARRLYNWPRVRDDQWYDTMAEAAALGLPRALDRAAEVTGVPHQKDAAGHRLMLQMCRPRKVQSDGSVVWWDDPAKRARLYAYCQQDVRAERDVGKRLRRLGSSERRVFLLDQRINDRGIGLDTELVTAARAAAQHEMERQSQLLYDITHGDVDSVTQTGRLKEWLLRQGLEIDSIAKAPMRDLLADETLPEEVHRALSIRAEAAKSSVAKLDAMLRCVDVDGRVRGLLRYHGASTGRWSGALVQPQNFPRPHFETEEEIEDAIQRVLDGQPVSLSDISSLLRSMLYAPPGRELVAGDYSAIEARVVAWVAGQQDLLAQFRAGVDPYKVMAARVYGVLPAEVTKAQRQHGKAIILGCGFGMGAEKFVSAAWDQYGVRVTAEESEASVRLYRTTYPAIPEYWRTINAAAMAAVQDPGTVHPAGPVRFTKRGAFLWCVLPSGRPLAYAAPQITQRLAPWGDMVTSLVASGVNSFTRKWERYALYGGLLTENVVQAVARDLMVGGMFNVEEAGYQVVLTVHDEIVTETVEGEGDLEHFTGLLTRVPEWALGCPVAVECWKGQRYRK